MKYKSLHNLILAINLIVRVTVSEYINQSSLVLQLCVSYIFCFFMHTLLFHVCSRQINKEFHQYGVNDVFTKRAGHLEKKLEPKKQVFFHCYTFRYRNFTYIKDYDYSKRAFQKGLYLVLKIVIILKENVKFCFSTFLDN